MVRDVTPWQLVFFFLGRGISQLVGYLSTFVLDTILLPADSFSPVASLDLCL